MPRPQPDIIESKAVKSLVEARGLRGATILGQPGGWAVLVRYGALERAIAAQRSRQMRLWRNVNTAIAYVRDELGLARFEIDTVAHTPDPQARKRPDQSERLRKQREAADYDTWFRAQVQIGIDAADRAEIISEEEMTRWFDKNRAELKRRASETGTR
jgi:hypothetical protein